MEITFVNKSKSIQPQQAQDMQSDPSKNLLTEENKQYKIKNKVDSAEISSSHTGTFEDKKLMIAKSAILYDVSVNSSATSANRVADLTEAVRNGNYDVPSNLIAEAILSE